MQKSFGHFLSVILGYLILKVSMQHFKHFFGREKWKKYESPAQ